VGIGRPKRTRLGIDFSGTVAAIGNDVRHFKVGDELFGSADGALAEFVTSNETGLASKPAAISFQQAAVVPIAGLTALQGLRDRGQVRPGQKVLINGASGGVGTFAVQIAKWLGAEVTGVCSTSNLSLVRSLGADHVIDYTREDYTRAAHYDLVFDVVGSRTLSDNLRSLTPHGTLVIVGAPNEGSWLGPMARFIQGWAIAPFVSQRIVLLQADLNRTEDLNVLRDMMQSGRLVPVIDRQYSLDETAAAMRYLEQGHARGKVVINVE
jgi:NADPH:quinone reductase-like Zn-dependent oxidoreductase